MIKSFKCSDTRKLFERQRVARFQAVAERARIKLKLLSDATSLRDLQFTPGNRLELLKGDRMGQYSIRISRQWRICFRWDGNHAIDVEVTDYH